jgi:hypothetical protein
MLYITWYLCNIHKYGKVYLINNGFLNTNTAITWQLIQTVRTLEEEWRQVLQGSIGTGQRKMSRVLGVFGLLGFTTLWPVLAWRAFWNLWAVYFFDFKIYFRATVNRGYWINGYGGTTVYRRHREFAWSVGMVPLEALHCVPVAV